MNRSLFGVRIFIQHHVGCSTVWRRTRLKLSRSSTLRQIENERVKELEKQLRRLDESVTF